MKFLRAFLLPLFFIVYLSRSAIVFSTSDSYLVVRDYYLRSHQDYLTARQNYLNHRTLQTKESFSQKLKQFLISRDDLLRRYLNLLLNEGFSLLPEKDLLEISSWIGWLDKDISKIDSVQSMEELLSSAEELENEYLNIERSIFIFLNKLTVFQQQKVAVKIAQLADEIRRGLDGGGEEAISYWLEEVTNKLDLAGQNQQAAVELMDQSKVRRIGDILRDWKRANKMTAEAELNLQDSLEFLSEIIKNLNS